MVDGGRREKRERGKDRLILIAMGIYIRITVTLRKLIQDDPVLYLLWSKIF